MDDRERQLRAEIAERVREIAELRHGKKPFLPGKTYVSYAGRVFDAAEMVDLVNTSLDFWLTAGPKALKFEQALAAFVGVRGSAFVNSGSSANLVAVSALTSPKLGDRRLKPGDEVITAAAGFPTTVNPILQNRAVPVFVDVEIGSYNVTAEAVEAAVTPRTKAIVVAHTLGNPYDVAALADIARRHGLWLVEDNCDALGATWDGQRTGSFGDLATLSFYPAHHITTGEGGAVLYKDELMGTIVESFRDWGRDCYCAPGKDNTCKQRFGWQLGTLPFGYDHKYVYSHVGYNLKATDMQAAIGLRQLEKLPSFLDRRRHNAMALMDALRPHEDVLVLPRVDPRAGSSWFGFPITVREGAPFPKAEIVAFLEENKVATRPLFSGNLVRHPAYEGAEYRIAGTLGNTDAIMHRTFFVGVYPGIDDPRLEWMIGAFLRFLRR